MDRLFKNIRLQGQDQAVDFYVKDGKFEQIGPNLDVQCDDVVDMGGYLAVPPYVDPHVHLDYVYTADNSIKDEDEAGTLFAGIERWTKAKETLTIEDVKARAKRAVKAEILQGVQFIRTHVDVTDPKLTGLKALLEVKDELKDIVTMQIVAFPQQGMYSYEGGAELVEKALEMGADVVGGIPHGEFTAELGEKSVHTAVDLAMKHGKLIDLHCDEIDDPQSRFLEVLATAAYMQKIGEKTTASHTCAFASYNNAYVAKLMKILKLSKINFISLPTENLYLEGRGDTYPKRRGLTRVKEIRDAGMNVCFGQDSIQDFFYPAGNGNLMNILDVGIHAAQTMSPEELHHALDFITVNGAKTLNISNDYGIEKGKPATFITLSADSGIEAVINRVGVLDSVRNGRFLFRRAPETITTDIDFLK